MMVENKPSQRAEQLLLLMEPSDPPQQTGHV